jgi:cytochrome c peroxidase
MRAFTIALVLGVAACRSGLNVAGAPHTDPEQLAAFGRIPASMPAQDDPANPARIALGRVLYYDVRLSLDRTVSCNTCHPLDAYGVDHRQFSVGVNGQLGSRNAPTVYNAAGHIAQFWDGRAPTVEEQAKGPILNPVEMAMPNGDAVIARLKEIDGYRGAFAAAFPGETDPLTYDNVGRAIGAFERRLVTPSRWDTYLGGDGGALSPIERQGLNTFATLGCTACHRGTYVGGEMFQKLGLVEPWPAEGDSGRYVVTHRRADRFVFKVPSLRNIEQTGPYFHDGEVATLDEAVRRMARYQLGRELRDPEVKAVVAWLKSLTGNIPQDYIAAPPEISTLGALPR